ncbi:MAG TPA: hypothetical protein VFU05_16070 [Cyclobacteriaceae bacterium]|nr:hypothetical protein [Cyclobacteriaceae bacterium]
MKRCDKLEYEFENIESLIRGAIEPATKSNQSFEERFAQVRNAVAVERDRIKKSFIHKVWVLPCSQQRTHYVQYHQYRLIGLIDELFRISQPEEKKPKCDSRISSEAYFLYDQLEDILNLMQHKLGEYFNLDTKIPASLKAKALKSIRDNYADLQGLLGDKENALINICRGHIKKLLEKEAIITYRKIRYMEMLIEAVGDLLRKNQDAYFPEREIQALFFTLNFNSSEYYRYYIDLIQKKLAEMGSCSEQLEQLAFYLKTINQTPAMPDMAFNSGYKTLRTQLTEWILEETQFLERRRDLACSSQVAENDFAKKDFKLEFDMSVSQFAFFIKAFIETGVIQNKNISELIRFLARFVKTKRSENISYESFRIKYYNVEGSTKDAVKSTLHTAIGFINSN